MFKKKQLRTKRRFHRPRASTARYQLAKDVVIDYKKLNLILKFLTDRGKIVARRITGVTAKQQRQLSLAIKQAQFLALLTTGGVKK